MLTRKVWTIVGVSGVKNTSMMMKVRTGMNDKHKGANRCGGGLNPYRTAGPGAMPGCVASARGRVATQTREKAVGVLVSLEVFVCMKPAGQR